MVRAHFSMDHITHFFASGQIKNEKQKHSFLPIIIYNSTLVNCLFLLGVYPFLYNWERGWTRERLYLLYCTRNCYHSYDDGRCAEALVI